MGVSTSSPPSLSSFPFAMPPSAVAVAGVAFLRFRLAGVARGFLVVEAGVVGAEAGAAVVVEAVPLARASDSFLSL